MFYKGTVRSGFGDASKDMHLWLNTWAKGQGLKFYPGTLNLKLDTPILLSGGLPVKSLDHLITSKWAERYKVSSQYDPRLYPARIRAIGKGDHVTVWLFRWWRPNDVAELEILAPVGLRSFLGLRDGSRLEVEVIPPDFSVCIINWNWLSILQESIAILRGENLHSEIIVLDNGSFDGSADWLKTQVGITPILLQKNRGASIGRNKLLDKAKGKYILLLDSDILYIPGSLRRLRDTLEAQGVDAIGFNSRNFTNSRKEYDQYAFPQELIVKDSQMRFAPTQYGLYKKEIFQKCRFDENFGVGYGWEDDDLYLQIWEQGWKIAYVDYKYFHGRGSKKWQKQHDQIRDTIGPRRQYLRDKWGFIDYPKSLRKRGN